MCSTKNACQGYGETEFKISPGEITATIKAGLEANTRMRLYTSSSMEAKQLAIDLKDWIKSKDTRFDWKILRLDDQEVGYVIWVCDRDINACSAQKRCV